MKTQPYWIISLLLALGLHSLPMAAQLRVSSANPRYFEDASGELVFLTGSFTWNALKDMAPVDPPEAFPYTHYLDWMQAHSHNFIRLFTWDLPKFGYFKPVGAQYGYATPHPFLRTGPGLAADGKPRFDLSQYDLAFFQRLRQRVEQARARGIYVSVMLFECWHSDHLFDSLGANYHPFMAGNHVNELPAVPMAEVYSLRHPQILAMQKAYVQRVLETLNDLDNVLYEVANELQDTLDHNAWQYAMIDFIHEQEAAMPMQHPVGMTNSGNGASNAPLFSPDCQAEWISPGYPDGYRSDPPAATGEKVIINDTDHLWGVGGTIEWIWQSVCRGLNVIYMDPLQEFGGHALPYTRDKANAEAMRRNMGLALQLMQQLPLARLVPQPAAASTSYCLAAPGEAYLVYQPLSGQIVMPLPKGKYHVYWLDPLDSSFSTADRLKLNRDQRQLFSPPEHIATQAVLILSQQKIAAPGDSRK